MVWWYWVVLYALVVGNLIQLAGVVCLAGYFVVKEMKR